MAQDLQVAVSTVRHWMQRFPGSTQLSCAGDTSSGLSSVSLIDPDADIATMRTPASRIRAGHVVSLNGGSRWGAVLAAESHDDGTVVLMVDHDGEPISRELLGPENSVLRIDAEPYESHPVGLERDEESPTPEVLRFQADLGHMVTVEDQGWAWRLTCAGCPDIEAFPRTRQSAIHAAHNHATSHRGQLEPQDIA